MDETKKVLRNLLIYSPTVLSVTELNDAFKGIMCHDIPYKDLGYEKLLDFLYAIPDVLRVNGYSLNSQVKLIDTEEIDHINDMIFKQNKGKRYEGNSNLRNKFNEQAQCRSMQGVNLVTSSTSPKYDDEAVQAEEQPRGLKPNYKGQNFKSSIYLNSNFKNKAKSKNRNGIFHPKSSKSDSEILNVDVALRPEKKNPEEQLEQEDTILRKQNFNDVVLSENNTDLKKCRKSKIKHTEGEKYYCGSRIPMQVQDDLKKLIKGIPEGIWCSQLPDEYKKIFGKELCFRKFGYRCLIHMCIDLKNIFYCNEESTCDFKLYDITRPIPDVKIAEDDEEYSRNVSSFEEDEPPSLPPLDWKTYAQLYPKDVVGRGFVIPRDFVNQSEIDSDIFRVVVAEIHDPSKFWLFRDDGQLDALMDEMQPFYKTNKERYRIPEQFLETGLYCVAMWQNEFHRCVIVKMQTNETFVHLFYIDYGSLATVPKNELWFLTKDFVRLPAQAIRARLADIYPLIELAMWTSEASDRFHQLADMKHLEARIVRVSREKKVIEISVKDHIAAPGRDINSILVDEGHALNWNQYRRMNICYSNFTPRGNFIHLFPDFEEIECCSHINESSENPNEEYESELTDVDCDNSLKGMSQLRRKSLDSNVPQYRTCNASTYRESPFSTATEEIDESFENSNREKIVPRKNNSTTDKLLDQLDTWIDLSQLENYLSHQSPSTSSANNGKLIDVDEFNTNIMSEKSESSDLDDSWLLLMSKGRSTGDEEEPSWSGRSDSDCSDLIQLDVPLECSILSPEIVGISDSMSQTTVSAIYFEEDEHSDVKSNTSVVSEVMVSPKRVNNTSTPIPTVPECTSLGVSNEHCSSGNLEMTSLCSPRLACHYQYWHSQYYQWRSLGDCLGNNQMHFPSMHSRQDVEEINTCTSSPRAQEYCSLSIPDPHCSCNRMKLLCSSIPACNFQVGHTQYQRWSLEDCSENNQIYYPSAQYSMNTPLNEMNFTPEHFFTQSTRTTIPMVSSEYNSR